jgi:hypothetical protein
LKLLKQFAASSHQEDQIEKRCQKETVSQSPFVSEVRFTRCRDMSRTSKNGALAGFIPASRGSVTSFPGRLCGGVAIARIAGLALARNGDVFIATGMAAALAGLGNRAGYFIRVDAPVGGSLGEIPRLAIGMGGMCATFLAPGKALVDAIVVRLVGNDENTTVGPSR